MATEYKKLVESGKIDLSTYLWCTSTHNVSIHVKKGVDAREYANSLIDEGTISGVYDVRGQLIRGYVPIEYLTLLAQREEIEKVVSTGIEKPLKRIKKDNELRFDLIKHLFQ